MVYKYWCLLTCKRKHTLYRCWCLLVFFHTCLNALLCTSASMLVDVFFSDTFTHIFICLHLYQGLYVSWCVFQYYVVHYLSTPKAKPVYYNENLGSMQLMRALCNKRRKNFLQWDCRARKRLQVNYIITHLLSTLPTCYLLQCQTVFWNCEYMISIMVLLFKYIFVNYSVNEKQVRL